MTMQDYFAMLRGLATQRHSSMEKVEAIEEIEETDIPERFAHWEAPSVFADNVKFLR